MKIEGADALLRGLKNSDRTAGAEIGKAILQSVVVLKGLAKKEVPVQTGRLQKSIVGKNITQKSGVVSATAKYASFVHGGTSAHTIRVRNKKVLANQKTGQIFGRVVHHPGTRANPFMTRAAKYGESPVQKIFKQAVENINKQITRG